MFSLFQDIRFGLRMLAKHRLATLISIVALALGIGANTAMFSVAEAFLLHPAPFENADRIVALVDARPQQNIDMNASPQRHTSTGARKRVLSTSLRPIRGMK